MSIVIGESKKMYFIQHTVNHKDQVQLTFFHDIFDRNIDNSDLVSGYLFYTQNISPKLRNNDQ